jgi:hypothetical protein
MKCWLFWPCTSTLRFFSLATLPRDIDLFRQLIFDLPIPFSLSTANWKLIWPLIDNVYSIQRTRPVTVSHVTFSKQYLICRFNATTTQKSLALQHVPISVASNHVTLLSASISTPITWNSTQAGVIRRRELVTVLGSEESEVSRDL